MTGRPATGSIDGMTTTHTTKSAASLAAPAPHWAIRAAHVIPLLTLPSCLWRVGLAVGVSAGVTERGYDQLMSHPLAVPYLVLLSLLSEALALLALGLVRPWGVVPPRWVPLLGGRRMRLWAVALTAGTGSAVLTALWSTLLWAWWAPEADPGSRTMTETGHTVIGLLYVPLAAWGPLLALLTFAYYRRHARRG
jgi:hypothetical protein